MLPSSGARLCGSCLLTWAFEPGETSADVADPEPQWDKNALALGSYVLMGEIGRGGMGVIYRAVHCATRETVALKTILPQYADNPEILARFRREAETAQSLEHPYTMPILEVGCSEAGVPFFTMPMAANGSLQHLSAKYHGRWRRIAELVAKVARAVHHAHQRGVLHRDIKPGNILFTEDHEPLVADFGLAKPLMGSADLTRSYAVLGTPNYVAPEQAAGQSLELTPAADIYSLGAVLYELLTGQPPFVGENVLDVLRQVGTKTPVCPRSLAPAVPQVLEQICLRCLERMPANRYKSARALASDLERWLAGHPVTPRPTRLRLRSFFGRRPVISAWSGVIGALLVALPFVWKTAGRSIVVPLPTSVAMVVEDLEPSAASRQVAKQLTEQLKQNVAASRGFRLLEQTDEVLSSSSASLDSLAFARSVSAQAVLTSYLHQSGDQLHLVTRFVRCDTGEMMWKHRDVLSLAQGATNLPAVARELVERFKRSWNEHLQNKTRAGFQPVAEAQIFYTHAMELAAHGTHRDIESAIDLFQRARKVDPNFAQACAMLAFSQWTLGYVYGQSDEFASAEKMAREALTLDPDSAAAHRVIASCYSEQARYGEAREEFEIAVELNPESAGCCQSLGMCLRQMGHPDQAIPWLRRATRLEPAHGSITASLGEALILCGLDEQAEAAFTRAAELDREKADPQFGLAALRVWQRRYDEARTLCATASRRFPDFRFKLDYAAWIEFCGGQFAAAQGYYETLRTENSYQRQWVFYGAINPCSALAFIARRSGSFGQSQALASESLAVDQELLAKHPGNSRVLHDVAATYAVIGDEEHALLYLEQAVSAGWTEHLSTRIDPRFGDIDRNPIFEALLRKMTPTSQTDRL